MESPITQATVYAVGVPIILLLIALEAGVSAWRNTHFYDARDSAGTLGMGVDVYCDRLCVLLVSPLVASGALPVGCAYESPL